MPFIRKLVPADLPKVKAHYARLDADDRYLRFGHGISESAVEAYLDQIDWFGTIILGYFQEGDLRGVVEIVPMSEGLARAGELALTVEKPWRGHGIGTELCRRALVLACNRRIREVAMICLTENIQMQRIAAKLNGRVLRRDMDVETRVFLPRSSPWSLLQEMAIAGGAAVGGLTHQLTGSRRPDEPPHGSGGGAALREAG